MLTIDEKVTLEVLLIMRAKAIANLAKESKSFADELRNIEAILPKLRDMTDYKT